MLPRKRALDLLLVSTALLAALTAACAGGKPIDVGPPGGDDDDDGVSDATFTTGVIPLMRDTDVDCGRAGCHIGGAPSGALLLPDAAGTVSVAAAYAAMTNGGISGDAINLAAPDQSLLLLKGANTSAHTGGKIWDDSDTVYETIVAWISSGAELN